MVPRAYVMGMKSTGYRVVIPADMPAQTCDEFAPLVRLYRFARYGAAQRIANAINEDARRMRARRYIDSLRTRRV